MKKTIDEFVSGDVVEFWLANVPEILQSNYSRMAVPNRRMYTDWSKELKSDRVIEVLERTGQDQCVVVRLKRLGRVYFYNCSTKRKSHPYEVVTSLH